MKKTIALLSFVFTLAVSVQAQKQFKILDATVMSWAGGMPQSGHGTVYSFKIVLLTKDKVSFEDLWVSKTYVPRQPLIIDYEGKYHEPTKGDTINVGFALRVIPQGNRNEPGAKPVTKPSPCDYKGEALLEYTIKGHRHYKTINSFRRLPPQNYP